MSIGIRHIWNTVADNSVDASCCIDEKKLCFYWFWYDHVSLYCRWQTIEKVFLLLKIDVNREYIYCFFIVTEAKDDHRISSFRIIFEFLDESLTDPFNSEMIIIACFRHAIAFWGTS